MSVRIAGRISAGDLRQRITLQQRDSGKDTFGQQVTTWTTVATVWAKAEPLTGREFFQAGQTQSAVDVRFSIRYRTDVLPAMRVQWRNENYEIVAVIDTDAARDKLELMCTRGIRDGRP